MVVVAEQSVKRSETAGGDVTSAILQALFLYIHLGLAEAKPMRVPTCGFAVGLVRSEAKSKRTLARKRSVCAGGGVTSAILQPLFLKYT